MLLLVGAPERGHAHETATATLQNHDYDAQGDASAAGTTDFTGTGSVDFADANMTEKDKCVTVSDSLNGPLGTVCRGEQTLPRSFDYSETVGPYATCGTYKVDNTATFTTDDTGATGSASWTVAVDVPCGGCSLTIGYWKTHAGFGPQADMVTRLLPVWPGTFGGLQERPGDDRRPGPGAPGQER